MRRVVLRHWWLLRSHPTVRNGLIVIGALCSGSMTAHADDPPELDHGAIHSGPGGSDIESPHRTAPCGPVSAAVVLRWMGIDFDDAWLLDQVQTDDAGRCSMLALQSALGEKGLEVRAWTLTPDDV